MLRTEMAVRRRGGSSDSRHGVHSSRERLRGTWEQQRTGPLEAVEKILKRKPDSATENPLSRHILGRKIKKMNRTRGIQKETVSQKPKREVSKVPNATGPCERKAKKQPPESGN